LIINTPRPVTSDNSQDPSSAGIVQIKEEPQPLLQAEIKVVNHTLKAEVNAIRNMLTIMGWKQATTVIEENNYAFVASSQVTHIIRGMRHSELSDLYFKEKVADGTCIILKIKSEYNNSDIGTKRVPLPLFTHPITDSCDSMLFRSARTITYPNLDYGESYRSPDYCIHIFYNGERHANHGLA
jgi:hypothetical protein